MSTQPNAHNLPPTGVLAASRAIAQALARELHITKPVCMSPKTLREGGHKGQHLGSVLIDQPSLVDKHCWPLEPRVKTALVALLTAHHGYVYPLQRVDPIAKKRHAHG